MAQRQFRSDDTSLWVEAFGNGHDGPLTVSGSTSYSAPNAGCSGTADTTTLTLDAASTFEDGMLVLIHQSRDSNADQTTNPNWELNKIASGAGTTTLTLAYPLTITYVDSGDSQAQIIGLREYTTITVNSSVTVTVPAWDGNKGGIIAYLASQSVTINGTLSLNGGNGAAGSSGSPAGGTGGGFRGGQGDGVNNDGYGQGFQGEGTGGPGTFTNAANGNGGGAAAGAAGGRGAGGGNGTAGGTATGSNTASGGEVRGNASLITMVFGGGGAGSTDNINNAIGGGGAGGGICIIIAPQIDLSGASTAIATNGGNGAGTQHGSGAGAGGSVLLKGKAINVGTSKITAAGGTPGSGGGSQGTGGVGRIHADYSQTFTGSATPTIDTTLDPTIDERRSIDSYAFFM